MPAVTYADPTTTRTPLNFDVLPPIQQASPIVNPPALRQPLNVQQTTGGQLARPIDYHAQPQNIPSVQQQIKLDGATWKTIDITPNSSARPRINTTQSVLAGTNVVSGNNFAQEQAFEQAAYLFGWSLAGFWDGAVEGKNYPNEQLRLKRDFAEDGAMTCCPEIDYRKIQAIIAEEVKKLDVTAAIPLSFQIRHEGDTPQMVIQCAQRKSAANGNTPARYDSAKYPITVPHWKGGQNDKPSLPPYKKGNWEGILVIADNSKVTINAQNESECIKILNAIKPWIDSKMLKGSYFKGGKIVTEEPIKQELVYPKYGRYFANGQKNNKPDWRVDFL